MAIVRTVSGPTVADTFDRADNDTVGGDWVEVTSDWDIVANVLRTGPNTADSLIKNTAASLDGGFVQCQPFGAMGTFHAPEIFLRYQDGSGLSGISFRYRASNGHGDLRNWVAGSPTTIPGTDIAIGAAGGNHVMQLHVKDGLQRARMWSGLAWESIEVNDTTLDGQSGSSALRSVSQFSQSITKNWNDFLWTRSTYFTVTLTGAADPGWKVKVYTSADVLVCEATESSDVAVADAWDFEDVFPLTGWAKLVITDSDDNVLDTFTGPVFPGEEFEWDGFEAAVLPDLTVEFGDTWITMAITEPFLDGETHTHTRWQVTTLADTGYSTPIVNTNSATFLLYFDAGSVLTAGTAYRARAIITTSIGGVQDPTDEVTFTTAAAGTPGTTPTVSLSQKGHQFIEVSISAYAHPDGAVEPEDFDPDHPRSWHSKSEIQIRLASDPDWSTPLETQTLTYTGTAESRVALFDGLTANTAYKFRGRELDGYLTVWTSYSSDLNQSTDATPAEAPTTPTLTIVSCGRDIVLSGSTFAHSSTGTQTAAQWAICTGGKCQSIVTTNPAEFEDYTWEDVDPAAYTLKVRYRDDALRWGSYSATQACTVEARPPVVVFTNPAMGAVVATSQTVQWEADDPEAIGWTFDGELNTGSSFSSVFTDQASASYIFSITGRANGDYLIRVRARNPDTDETGEWAYLPITIDRTGSRAVHYHFADFVGDAFPSTWRQIWAQDVFWGFKDVHDALTDTDYRVGIEASVFNTGTDTLRSGLVFDELGEPDEFDMTVTFEHHPKECAGIGNRFANAYITRGGGMGFGVDGAPGVRSGHAAVMDWGIQPWTLGENMACVSNSMQGESIVINNKWKKTHPDNLWHYGQSYRHGKLHSLTYRPGSSVVSDTVVKELGIGGGLSSPLDPIAGPMVWTDPENRIGFFRKLYTLQMKVRRGVQGGSTGWFIQKRILGPGVAFDDYTTEFLSEYNAAGSGRIACGACGLAFQDMEKFGLGRSISIIYTDFSIRVLSYGDCTEAEDAAALGCEADWRFTMFERDDITPWYGSADAEGNVIEADFYDRRTCPRPFLISPKNFSETEINFPEGRSRIGQITVQVADKRLTPDQATGIVTARIGEAKGRRGVLERWREDLGYVTVFDGVVESVELDPSISAYTFHLRDPRERERDVEMFTRNETFALWPTSGPIAAYGQRPNDLGPLLTPAQPRDAVTFSLEGTAGEITYGYIQLSTLDLDHYIENVVYPWGFPSFIGQPAVGLSSTLLSGGTTGYYRHTGLTVRWRPSAGGDWTYLRDMPSITGDNAIVKPERLAFGGWRLYMAAFDADDIPGDSDLIDVQILAAKTSETTPYFWDNGTIGGAVLAAYDGEFSEQIPNIRFDRDRMEEWAEQTPSGRFIARAVEPSLRRWVEKNGYGAIGWAPALGTGMKIIPVEWELPPADEELVELNADWLIPVGQFSDAVESIINHVVYTYIRESVVPLEGGFGTVLQHAIGGEALRERYQNSEWTRLVEEPVERHYVYGPTLAIRESKLEYSPTTVRSFGLLGEALLALLGVETADAVADKIGNNVIYRFGEGAAEFDVEVRAGQAHGPGFDPYTLDVVAGQWVKVRASWIPDYQTGRRGAFRYMQIKGITDPSIDRRRFRMIDGGPVLEESATGESDDPSVLPFLQPPDIDYLTETEDLRVEVTVEFDPDSPEASRVRVEFAVGTSEPDAADFSRWTLVGYLTQSGTITTPSIPAGETVWIRARTEAPQRRPSVWTDAEAIVISETPGLLEFRLTIDDNGLVTAAWTPNAYAEGLRFETSGGAIGHTPSFSTFDDVDSDTPLTLDFTGEEIGYDEELYVRVTAYPGFSAGSVTGSAGAVYTLRIPRPLPSETGTHEWGAHTDTDFLPPEQREHGHAGIWNPYTEKFELEILVPPGGTTGQVLKKQSNADWDTDWEDDDTGAAGGYSEGTSFPGSPSTDDKFYRTDRNILYFYDGTRWLSVNLYTLPLVGTVLATSATTAFQIPNPWWNLYDVYVLRLHVSTFSSTTTAANYFTHQFSKADGATPTNVGSSISGQGNTQNAWVGQEVAINAVITATHEAFGLTSTETGTSSTFITATILYRLVG